MSPSEAKCLYCERNKSQVPLVPVHFKEAELWICAQHLPLLIHKPAELAGKLPGAERLTAAE